MNKINVLNVPIDNLTKDELLSKLGQDGGVVFTPNVDHLMKLQKDPDFHKIYQSSNYRVCDSKILLYASRFLGKPIQEKISGSDLFPAFYQYYRNSKDKKIFLLGAAEGVAKRAQENINKEVGWEMVIDSYSPPFGFEKDEAECQRIVDRINNSEATVLAVGVGAPKQEKWIAKYKNKLKKIKIFLAIGATIDFEAGEKPRSPQWMSEFGLEWLHRLQSEPQRLWKRYLIEDLPFFWLLLKQKLNAYQTPFSANLDSFYRNLQLGQLLRQTGLISEEQVRMALEIQQTQSQHLRLGEIFVRQGWLEPETIEFFAEELPQLVRSGQRQPLGYYLKSAKLLNESQIDMILAEQRQVDLRFGEVAVQKGWVKSETIDSLLYYVSGQPESKMVQAA